MPQRPSQHVTEEKSRRAFRKVVPPEWVVRDVTPDYGLDLEVEIFVGGAATGLLFKVQVKGSNQDDLVMRLSQEKPDYYNSIELPVLVVLYDEPHERLFVR